MIEHRTRVIIPRVIHQAIKLMHIVAIDCGEVQQPRLMNTLLSGTGTKHGLG